ncbi:MAG: hypothetical protein QXF86_03195 [Candidatus Bilamarchaeaceae archaeon]
MTQVQNERAAGKFATGFKFNVFEFKAEGDTVYVDYAKVIYPDGFIQGKNIKAINELEDGLIISGYAKHALEFVGRGEEMLKNARRVAGNTYPIKEIIKSFGFIWKQDGWVKKEG